MTVPFTFLFFMPAHVLAIISKYIGVLIQIKRMYMHFLKLIADWCLLS